VSFTISAAARFSVAGHQASKTTPSVGQWSPSDLMVKELSGENSDTRRPLPTCSSQLSVMANDVEFLSSRQDGKADQLPPEQFTDVTEEVPDLPF
jgi:hypothetical protein